MDYLGVVGALLARELLLLVVGADLLGGLLLEAPVLGKGCLVVGQRRLIEHAFLRGCHRQFPRKREVLHHIGVHRHSAHLRPKDVLQLVPRRAAEVDQHLARLDAHVDDLQLHD